VIIKTPRIMIVGTHSGCGKTTVTCALLKIFKMKGINAVSFKSGPDYIDPMFHTKVLRTESSNLDMFLLSENTICNLFYENSKNSDIAIIESAMGLYDGKGFDDDKYSGNHLSRVIKVPQILVVDVKGKSVSLLAEIYGYLTYKPNNIKAVILNNCSDLMYNTYKKMIEENLKIKVVGYIPKIKECIISSRHLGLITANEIIDIENRIDILGEKAIKIIEIDEILKISNNTPNVDFKKINIEPICKNNPVIAVASDKAFCFYYKDGLKLLEQLGVKLLYFSPLNDKKLPKNINGIILGGGYPEENAQAIEKNESMRLSIKNAAKQNIPIFAECGGFMYLGNTLEFNNKTYKFCNVINSDFYMTDKLVRFGYSTIVAKTENMLMKSGEEIPCHEFHYTDGTFCGDDLLSKKTQTRIFSCGVCNKNIFALYPHIHFWSNLEATKSFVKICDEYIK